MGTPRDPVAAAGWYCRAALAGVEGYSLDEKAEAGHPLLRPFDLYVRPWHRDRNFVPSTWVEVEQHNAEFRRALSLYREAAGAKKPNASLQIAEMYAAGRDVPPNLVKAWLWFTIAAQHSSADARAKIAEIESRMTGNELKEARQLLPGLIEELNHAASALRESAERQEGH